MRRLRITDSILEFSKKPLLPVYDPLSLFTRLRVLIRSPESTEFGNRCETLFQTNESAFLDFAKFYLRQNHYVTSRALECLQPALAYRPFSPILDVFIASELGHDELMWQSLQALEVTAASSIDVLPEVEGLMHLLKHAAMHCHLGFVVLIELLENESPSGQHPIATLLAKSEKGKKAAWGLAKHSEINARSQHDEVAFSLARRMKFLNRSSALATIHLVEKSVRLRDGIREKMMDFLDNLFGEEQGVSFFGEYQKQAVAIPNGD